jgi:two-component system, NarL family, response regulator DegU
MGVVMAVSILIADDHPIFRAGLRQIIESSGEFHVVAEASDAVEALALARSKRPAALVLDMDMPGGGGLAVARAARTAMPTAAVLFLTVHKVESLFNEAMDSGALGYVMKECAVQEILAALKSALAGRVYLSPSVGDFLLSRQRRASALAVSVPGLADLTPSERRVLKLITENKTSKDIGQELGISYRTVERHRTNVAAKLGLSGTHSLVKFAFDHKSDL